MIIYNVTEEILRDAMDAINRVFDGNIAWKTFERMNGRTRDGGEKWSVTLTVVATTRGRGKSKTTAPGTRRGFERFDGGKAKRIAAACWHVHGVFFDALPRTVAVGIRACVAVRIVTGRITTRPGDPWNDFNIGSQYRPLYFSEACDCAEMNIDIPSHDEREAERSRNFGAFATVT